MSVTSTVSAIELLWIIISLGGLIASSSNFMNAWDSYQVAKASRNGRTIKMIVSAEHIRAEVIYLLIHSLYIGVGWLASLTPPAPAPTDIATSRVVLVVAILVPAAFFIVQIAMIVNSLIVRRDRQYLLSQRLVMVEGRQLKPETLAILERLASHSEALERLLLQEAEERANAVEKPVLEPLESPEQRQD